jgi:hypothetical protein
MVISAAILISWRVISPRDPFQNLTTPSLAMFAISQAMLAAGVTAAGFSVYWQWRGFAALVQPGQWLLLSYALMCFDILFRRSISTLQFLDPLIWQKNILLWDVADFESMFAYLILFLVQVGPPLLLYGWGTWRIADTRPWRVFYVVMMLHSLLNMVMYHFRFGIFQWGVATSAGWIFSFTGIASLLLILWSAVSDLFSRRPRYWTHWFGAGLAVAGRGLYLASSLLIWLLT